MGEGRGSGVSGNTLAKQLAGARAAELVQDGMVIGLGTGSTALWTIRRLGERVRQEGLRVTAVPTSEETRVIAAKEGILLTTLDDVPQLDLAIDGADEVDRGGRLIKGGGGALLREKLVASAAREFVVVADETKLVATLGRFALPVEIVQFAWTFTARRVAATGCSLRRRETMNGAFVTDNGNYILDCDYGVIAEPAKLHAELKQLPGVVETGLFIDMAAAAIVSDGKTSDRIEF